VAGFAAIVAGGQFGKKELRTTVHGLVEPHSYRFVDEERPERGFVADRASAPVWATNNRGELLGMCWSYLLLLRGRALGRAEIVSDSTYVINTATKWYDAWESKGIVDEKENPDLTRIMVTLKRSLEKRATLAHVHVNSHVAKPSVTAPPGAISLEEFRWSGNASADALCVKAREERIAGRISSPLYILRALVNNL
jgi:ribonuclease HI